MSAWLLVALGVVAYVLFVVAVIGMCRAAADADRRDRAAFEAWLRARSRDRLLRDRSAA